MTHKEMIVDVEPPMEARNEWTQGDTFSLLGFVALILVLIFYGAPIFTWAFEYFSNRPDRIFP